MLVFTHILIYSLVVILSLTAVFILIGDFVFLRGPPAEVYEFASFRTKWLKRVFFPRCLFLAYRTLYLHKLYVRSRLRLRLRLLHKVFIFIIS